MPNISACYLANRVMFSKWSIHFLSCFLIQGHERMEPVPAVTVERQGTPWTGLQCTAGRTQRRRQSFMLMFSPTANLDSPINLISMFLDYTVFGVYPERISYKWFQAKKVHMQQSYDLDWLKNDCLLCYFIFSKAMQPKPKGASYLTFPPNIHKRFKNMEFTGCFNW